MSSKPTTKRLDTIRAELEALQAQRAELQDLPLPRAEAIERAHQWVDSQAAQFNGAYKAQAFGDTESHPDLFRVTAPPGGELQHPTADTGPMLCWLLTDALKAKLAEALAPMPDDLPRSADRPAMLAKLANQIDALECEEEQVFRALHQQGEAVDRRPDVDVRIALTTTAALAGALDEAA